MVHPKKDPPKGILNRQQGEEYFQHSRYQPSDEVSFFVEHYWVVQWNLENKETHRQEVLSHPSVHLVFERNNSRITGVVTGKFSTILRDSGKVLGIKFRPGGFYPFYKKSVASIADQNIPFSDLFDEDIKNLEKSILNSDEPAQMAEQAEEFLRRHLPEQDPNVEIVSEMVECIRQEPSILKVDDLVQVYGKSKRSLQRIFKKYVGVSPKWVIQRYRLHEAAEKMADGKGENWPRLAMDLGYFDQAHFIRDFKSVVGQTPGEFVQELHPKK